MTRGQRVRIVHFDGRTEGRLIGREGTVYDARSEGAVVVLDGDNEPIKLFWDEIEYVKTETAASARGAGGGR